ncbi:unnamed protein product [Thelazia callipaeda]|uniref:Regulator of microtubule dynamics protein 1 n=1 Tax=Thelazia callipaeda TaxID=103827 RepID=A0A0N5D709_THECL|nr:unnamed protein product [Thelazia callipaeda]
MAASSEIFAQLDDFLNAYEGDKAYNLAKTLLEEAGEKVDTNLYLCFMHACYIVSNCSTNEIKRKTVLDEAYGYGKKIFELEPNNREVLKWCAIITGSLAEVATMKEKIALGHEFKNYLDKAAENEPDSSIFHMRGRFSYQIANLSWLERTAASVVFGAPPYATIENALSDLLRAEELNPGQIDNQLYIAKCYLDQGDRINASKYLTNVIYSHAVDEIDVEQQNEARKLIENIIKEQSQELITLKMPEEITMKTRKAKDNTKLEDTSEESNPEDTNDTVKPE